jgi:hypothetical protein
MACASVCVAISVMQMARNGSTITVMQRRRASARILAVQLAQVGEAIAVMQAALFYMAIFCVMHLMVKRFTMLCVVHCALVARAFSGARTLYFGRVGDRHLWRLIATKYLCFFFRHDSPQQKSDVSDSQAAKLSATT